MPASHVAAAAQIEIQQLVVAIHVRLVRGRQLLASRRSLDLGGHAPRVELVQVGTDRLAGRARRQRLGARIAPGALCAAQPASPATIANPARARTTSLASTTCNSSSSLRASCAAFAAHGNAPGVHQIVAASGRSRSPLRSPRAGGSSPRVTAPSWPAERQRRRPAWQAPSWRPAWPRALRPGREQPAPGPDARWSSTCAGTRR